MAAKNSRARRSATDVAGLGNLDVDELRALWTELFAVDPLPRISRELLIRGVACRLQEAAEGGLSRKTLRKLERLATQLQSSGSISVAAAPVLRPGTRLVREWQGRVHEVIVLEDQYLWKGTRYRSLSEIARLITGTRWSGPRFFGTAREGTGTRIAGGGQAHASNSP